MQDEFDSFLLFPCRLNWFTLSICWLMLSQMGLMFKAVTDISLFLCSNSGVIYYMLTFDVI